MIKENYISLNFIFSLYHGRLMIRSFYEQLKLKFGDGK